MSLMKSHTIDRCETTPSQIVDQNGSSHAHQASTMVRIWSNRSRNSAHSMPTISMTVSKMPRT